MSMLWNGWDNSHLIKIFQLLGLKHDQVWASQIHMDIHLEKSKYEDNQLRRYHIFLLLIRRMMFRCLAMLRWVGCCVWEAGLVSVWLAPNTRDNISRDRPRNTGSQPAWLLSTRSTAVRRHFNSHPDCQQLQLYQKTNNWIAKSSKSTLYIN